MTSKPETPPPSANPYTALQRIFHEPARLAIMSALAGAVEGLSFTDLKSVCDLTDGNLNRHLKALSEFGAVKVKRVLSGSRPRSIVSLTAAGRRKFVDYLGALEDALKHAAANLEPEAERAGPGARAKRNPVAGRAVEA